MYHEFGAHVSQANGESGTQFTVWAPNACEVSVMSNGNGWSAGQDTLMPSDSGVWSGFVSGIGYGDTYKFGVKTRDGQLLEKADPFAFHSEYRPKTASIVYDLAGHDWQDGDWLSRRASTDWLKQPISIYEVHLASWKRPTDGREYLSYRELAHELADYVREMGFTHIQLMPVTEYPFDGSWGYQSTGYFAATSRFGTPHDLMYLVDHLHQAGIGVFIDWVPAHFPEDSHGLANFDGTCCYEHEDPRQGFHPDWKSCIFNFGRHEVREFLINSARFWLDQYHVDGLRVDAVASMLYLDYSREDGEWVPNAHGGRENLEAVQFLKDMNSTVHGEFPGVLTIAEESTAWPGVSEPVYNGGLGFSMKWDMGWMNDTLTYLNRDPIHRSHHQNELSFRMVYAWDEKFVLPLSHDEVVHGKGSLISQMPGDTWQQLANLRLLFAYQFTMPGKKLLFMGNEFGQRDEWNAMGELDWQLCSNEHHDGIKRFVGDLNRLYCSTPALHENEHSADGFEWLQCDDARNSVFAFARFNDDRSQHLVVLMNGTPTPRHDYRIGVIAAGQYEEILNSDAAIYGGGNIGNLGLVESEDVEAHGRPQSLSLNVPPLGFVVLNYAGELKSPAQVAVSDSKLTASIND
jgi:1,4-alpha-glucan branching enzyme